MKKVKQAISIILIVSLVTSLLQIPAYAAVVTKGTVPIPYDNADTGTDETVVPKIIGELTDKRDEYVKHFLNDDYSYEAVVYQEPVHYLEEGEWKEVDNTLKKADDTTVISEDASKAAFTKGNVVKNQSNDYEVSFAKNANVNKLVQLKKDEYELLLDSSGCTRYSVRDTDVGYGSSTQ